MFFPKTSSEESALDKEILRATKKLNDYPPASAEYANIADQLTKLYELKQKDKPDRVSRDTLVMVAANLIGIAVIVGHERTHVIATKAGNFVQKIR